MKISTIHALWLPMIALIIVCGCNNCIAGEKRSAQTNSPIVSAERAEYVRYIIGRLKSYKPTDKALHQVEELQGKFLHHGGHIPVGKDGWVYCIGHSFHGDAKRKNIGDVNMAIDQEGTLYTNPNHLCEGPVFWSTSRDGLVSMNDFFAENWTRYVPEQSSEKGKEAPRPHNKTNGH